MTSAALHTQEGNNVTVNPLALAGAIGMFTLTVVVFSLWFERQFPFGDSCQARVVLFVTGFGTGFLAFWAFVPDNLTGIICIRPLIGLGVGGYTGILMPIIVSRLPQKSSGESVAEKETKPAE